jgi:uncharacterized protein YegP (UPF0339 family)
MKSYVKILGPPVLKAIKALEKIAIDMPEVCIMNSILESAPQIPMDHAAVEGYFSNIPGADVSKERCSNIISKSGEALGDYDFFFEWFTLPNQEQLNALIGKIDSALAPVGVKYTIESKPPLKLAPSTGAAAVEEEAVSRRAPAAKFEVYKDAAGKYRFRLKAPNYEIIAVSEAYNTKNGCLNGIESVKLNAPRAEVEDQTVK